MKHAVSPFLGNDLPFVMTGVGQASSSLLFEREEVLVFAVHLQVEITVVIFKMIQDCLRLFFRDRSKHFEDSTSLETICLSAPVLGAVFTFPG